MRTWMIVGMYLISGCSAGERPRAEPTGHRHRPDGPVELKTPPLVRMAEFHGHLGPYVVLGYRAGEAAREILESPGYFDLDAEVVSPLHTPQSCFIDGVQLGSGCTVGKRNLAVTEGEVIGGAFRSKGGKALRIDLRPELPGRIAEWIEREGVEATALRVLKLERKDVFNFTGDGARSRAAGEEMALALSDGVTLRFLWAPPGKFIMGSPPEEPHRGIDEAAHEVTLTRGFWLGKYEVTNREFRRFRPGHRSWGIGGEKGDFDGEDQPAVCVDLADAEAFCAWASEKTGRRLRLPTEAEWEYACRAGSSSRYSFGDDESRLGDHCWYSADSGGVTHPVGQKRPNRWGFHDMHGNVAEWVSDWYGYYPGGPQTDPRGPPSSGQHSWRECSWSSRAFEARCAQRDRAAPGYKSAALGLRVVCEEKER